MVYKTTYLPDTNFDLINFINELARTMEKETFQFTFNEYSIKFGLVGLFISFIIINYFLSTKKNYVKEQYGSAKWGEMKDISYLQTNNVVRTLIKREKINIRTNLKILKRDKNIPRCVKKEDIKYLKNISKISIENIKRNNKENCEIILSQDIKFNINCQYPNINNNIIVYGGSGSSKTRGFVMPNVLNLCGSTSFVITDPKGEIYLKSRYYLRKAGYKIKVLNLFEKYHSSNYNPFKYIHVDRDNYDWQEDVLILIDTMIANLDGGEARKSTDPFWDDSSIHFVQALFFFIVYALKEEDRNMNSFMELLGMLEIGEDEDNCDSDLDLAFEWFGNKFGRTNIAYRTYRDFRSKASGKTAKSIVMTIISKFQRYNIESMKRLSNKDDLELDRMGEEKIALFVIVPPVSKTFNFVAGMVFTQLFQELNYCANALHNGRLPIPVQFFMDEYANTCIVPNFEKIIAYARSLGIGIAIILQAREQLKSMHEKTYEVISDNCAFTLFLGGIKSQETLENLSKRIGEGTFDERDYSVSKGSHSSTSISYKKVGRSLLKPEEIGNLPPNDCLVFVAGKPFYSHKYNYLSHPNYKYTSDFDKRYIDLYVKEFIEPTETINDKEVDKTNILSITHGEDKETMQETIDNELNTLSLLKADTDISSIVMFMKNNLLGLNIDNDSLLLCDEGENPDDLFHELFSEDREKVKQIHEEISNDKSVTNTLLQEISQLYEEFETNSIKTNTIENEPEEILELVKQFDNYSYDVDFANDELLCADEEEYLEDIASFDNILNNAKSLKDEMNELDVLKKII